MVKIPVNRYITRRIATTRKEVEASTQKLRTKTLKNLEEIFKAAAKIARGEIKHQRTNHKMVRITLRQKRRWLLVAGHTAQIIKNITNNLRATNQPSTKRARETCQRSNTAPISPFQVCSERRCNPYRAFRVFVLLMCLLGSPSPLEHRRFQPCIQASEGIHPKKRQVSFQPTCDWQPCLLCSSSQLQ